MNLLALGDSYTIGEGVAPKYSYPESLADRLREAGYGPYTPEIIAKTGWTTGELLHYLEKHPPELEAYPVVLLLIGVNNQYRGLALEVYKNELARLADLCLEKSGKHAGRVIIVSIPDYSVTPFAREKDPPKIAEELDHYNALAKEKAERYGFHFVDITDISRLASDDSDLLVEDALHPSPKMYNRWVDRIFPIVEAIL